MMRGLDCKCTGSTSNIQLVVFCKLVKLFRYLKCISFSIIPIYLEIAR